ncbi:MAG: hypothetical protein WCB68_01760 [Pyrinomonadaceae bacterium]
MPNILSGMWGWLKSRGPFTVLNLLVGALALWLVAPYFGNISPHPAVLGRYSIGYFCVLLITTFLIATLVSLALSGSHKINRNLFLTILALFVLSEIYVRRFFKTQPEPDKPESVSSPEKFPHSFYPRPYVEFGGEPNARLLASEAEFGAEDRKISGEEVRNELGFRGPLPVKDKGSEFRIIVLGGSTVFAGFPLENSIPGQLEQLFHRDGRADVRVYNWGVPAYVSGQELAEMAQTVPAYQPDLVIVYDGFNDLYFPYALDPRPGYPFTWLEHETGMSELRRRILEKDYSFRRWLSHSSFLQLVLTGFPTNKIEAHAREFSQLVDFNSLRKEAGYGSQEWKEKIASAYLGNQNGMCLIAGGAHFKVATFLQPSLAFKRHLTAQEAALPDTEAFQQHFRDVYQRILRAARETNSEKRGDDCYFFDLSNIFLDDSDDLYADSVHINSKGNKMVAQHIYEQLKNSGLAGTPK